MAQVFLSKKPLGPACSCPYNWLMAKVRRIAQLCRQLLTDTAVAIIRSLGASPFTPCFRWNGPPAHPIPYTRSIPLTQMCCPSIHLDLSRRKPPSSPLQGTSPCRIGSIRTRFTKNLRERLGIPNRMVTRLWLLSVANRSL